MNNNKIQYSWVNGGGMLSSELLTKMSALYSTHYGKWGEASDKAGGNVKLSPELIQKWISSKSSGIYYATIENEVIGYAIAVIAKDVQGKTVAWITQLVVHKDYRNQSVAKRILLRIWGQTNCRGWGIVSANPYAIRALEKVTRRRCDPVKIGSLHRLLLNFAEKHIPYINKESDVVINNDRSTINTKFPIDHSEVPEMIAKVSSTEVEWLLGEIDEGWEWFAFTFNEQNQLELSKDEIQSMLEASDEITKYAYSRMNFDEKHGWMNYTKDEVDNLIEYLQIAPGAKILDIGCGVGRHTIEFCAQGYDAIGVDYSEELIKKAKSRAADLGLDAKFEVVDCTETFNKGRFDAVICLYDVIGSFVDHDSNSGIIKNIAQALNDNGKAILSVMNFEHHSTSKDAKKFSFATNPSEILSITASDTMQRNGNIFNPKHMIVDDYSKVVYRREIFTEIADLPQEWIVRDKRFTLDEIVSLCQENGLKVTKAIFAKAGDWKEKIARDEAKEIVLICEKLIDSQLDFFPEIFAK